MNLINSLRLVKRLLKEYNSSGNMTNISAPGGKKAFGKSYDRMAQGLSDPYKAKQDYETKYMKVYPVLGGMIKQLKNSPIVGDKVVTGKALDELNKLLSTFNPKPDENGEVKLPFGDNIRLKIKGDKVFIGFSQEALKRKEQS